MTFALISNNPKQMQIVRVSSIDGQNLPIKLFSRREFAGLVVSNCLIEQTLSERSAGRRARYVMGTIGPVPSTRAHWSTSSC